MASLISKLTLSSVIKSPTVAPIQLRRQKLVSRIDEQVALAKAIQNNAPYNATRYKTVVDQYSGEKTKIELPKTIHQWWFTTDNNKVGVSIRYGAGVLEIAKGKYTIELNAEKDLIPTLELVREATLLGELDAQLTASSSKLRQAFKKQ